MHYVFRKYVFNILSSLCIYNMIHFNNHRILFFQCHKLYYKWKLVLLLIKIYKTIDVFYIKPLYMLTCSQKPFFFFGLVKKNVVTNIYSIFFLLDEHSYKLKKGISWTDHIKHKTTSEAPSCAILFCFS